MKREVLNPEELLTERLRLVPARLADIPRLHTHWSAPQVRQYLWDDRLITQDDVWDAVGASLEMEMQLGLGLTCVFERANKQFIGVAGLMCLTHVHTDAQPEIIYSLEPHAWGHGYATEASLAVLHHAFKVMGLPRVLGLTDPPNTRSLKLLHRLHMQPLPASAMTHLPYMQLTREHFFSRFKP
jgi:[ribosomal protein S5]-alanine N-acetyltransferase